MVNPLTSRLVRWSFALGLGLLVGCNGLWDDMRSRDFSFQSLFTPGPDPFEVLKHSKDGDRREKAYRALGDQDLESLSPEEKSYLIEVLSTGAQKEQQFVARLAAVQTLSKFRVPQAVSGLKDAYYRANNFSPRPTSILKCQILTGLGETQNPEAVEFLTKVLKEPPIEGTVFEEDQRMAERIAAARALGNFSTLEAAGPLVATLRREKNVALRGNATRSLRAITNQNFSDDAQAWADYLYEAETGKRTLREEKGLGQQIQEIVPVGF